jgi:hypothetical protein
MCGLFGFVRYNDVIQFATNTSTSSVFSLVRYNHVIQFDTNTSTSSGPRTRLSARVRVYN